MNRNDTIFLFDVDGTLTPPRRAATKEMKEFLSKLMQRASVGLVGGSDLGKISEQMGDDLVSTYDYVFAENGLIAYSHGKDLGSQHIKDYIGEDKCQEFINFALKYMSELVLPFKRGTFVEFRTGLINISPCGRGCNQKERDLFNEYDNEHKVREKFISKLKDRFPDSGLVFSIGGQISFDVFPDGWDKRYCLRYLEKQFKTIHFFGDKTDKGGNDHEIFADTRTIGHKVASPADTIRQINEIL